MSTSGPGSLAATLQMCPRAVLKIPHHKPKGLTPLTPVTQERHGTPGAQGRASTLYPLESKIYSCTLGPERLGKKEGREGGREAGRRAECPSERRAPRERPPPATQPEGCRSRLQGEADGFLLLLHKLQPLGSGGGAGLRTPWTCLAKTSLRCRAARGAGWARAPRHLPASPTRRDAWAPRHARRPFPASFPARRAARGWGEAGQDPHGCAASCLAPRKRGRPAPCIRAGGRRAALCRGCCSGLPARPRGSPTRPGRQRAEAPVGSCAASPGPHAGYPSSAGHPGTPLGGGSGPACLPWGSRASSAVSSGSPAGRRGGRRCFASGGDRCRAGAG